MANSKITITFNTRLQISEYIEFEIELTAGGSVKVTNETWVAIRNNKYLINYQEPTSRSETYPDGSLYDTFKYAAYWNLDYNTAGNFIVTATETEVVIEATTPDYIFSNFDTDSDATAVIQNVAVPPTFELTTDSVSQASDNCNFVDWSFVSSINIKQYELDGTLHTLNSTSFNTSQPRGKDFKIRFIDDDDRSIYYPGQTIYTYTDRDNINIQNETINYNKLAEENINPNVVLSISGSSLVVNVEDKDNLTLEYSLDNSNFQSNNVFNGLLSGNYTIYVKDQFNCLKSKDFIVDGIGSVDPFIYVSKANPIRFVKVESIDNVNIYKNDDNTFDYNGLEDIRYCGNRIFNSQDRTQIQFKSSYKNNIVKLRESNGTETSLSVNKKSANLGRYEKLDCYYFSHSSGKLGVYFQSGNTYDSLDTIIGTYLLNGNLPQFAKIGNKIEIDGVGVLDITNTFLESSLNKKIILTDYKYSGEETAFKVACIYNLLPYEIYEVDIDFSSYSDDIDFVIEYYNDVNTKYYYQSENYYIQSLTPKSISIISFNDLENNRDVFYKYGIRFFSRHYFSTINLYSKDDSEININDYNVTSIKSDLKFGNEFVFEDLTKSQAENLAIILSLEYVFINGIGYIKDGSITIDDDGVTNLYKLTAKMIKTNIGYTTDESVFSGTDELVEELYVPNLLENGTDFIKL